MLNRMIIFLILAMGALPCFAHAELIVLAAPKSDDPYYKKFEKDIFEFHVSFAKAIEEHGDQVLILVDERQYREYVRVLDDKQLLIYPMSDIWMRDFSLSNTSNPVMFRYTAEGQAHGANPQADADYVQNELFELLSDAGLLFGESNLLNDGGNFVDDYEGNVVISKKFLRDNNLSEDEGRIRIKAITGAENVAFIEADEQGGLEHADGVAAFVGKNVLIVNEYSDDQNYAKMLMADLERGLPGVKIHKIVAPYDGSRVYDENFGSACGLYTNALVTPRNIYVPQFGIPEDEVALAQIRKITNKNVVPVISEGICAMGGGIRCMSWQIRGDNARLLVKYAADARIDS